MRMNVSKSYLSWPLAVLALVAASTIAFAAPSYAAPTLPPNDGLFAFPCYPPDSPNAQLLVVDPTTGVATARGSGNSAASVCPEIAAWDPATGTAYLNDWDDHDSVYTVNLATGASTFAYIPAIGGTPVPQDDFHGFAVAPNGDGYALVDVAPENATPSLSLYSMDMATGQLTHPIATQGLDPKTWTLAADPAEDNTLYALSESDNLFTIDTSSGLVTPLAALTFGAGDVPSALQFDSNGLGWILDKSGGSSSLWTVDPSLGAAATATPGVSELIVDGSDLYCWPLLEVPASAPTQFVSATTATAIAGRPFSFTAKANGWAYPTYSITDGTLPAGLSLDPTTGVVSGTAATAGTFPLTIEASNEDGTTTQKLTLTVAPVLATTGVDPAPMAAGALAMLVLGAAIAIVAHIRRRRGSARRAES